MIAETVDSPLDRTHGGVPLAACLHIVFPTALREVIYLEDDELVLGRAPGAKGHVLNDPSVSRRHCMVRRDATRDGETHTVHDLGSRNGSRADGNLLSAEPLALNHNSVVRIGDVLAVYERGHVLTLVNDTKVARDAVLGESAAAINLRRELALAAVDHAPLLLVGETGTGKEVIAREAHRLSGRAGPFLAINCAALSPLLIESQLFGHQKGAFTGAAVAHDGIFRAAEGGTVLLDEIGELPLELQPKLLRVLQEREVHPVGDTKPVSVDVRVIAATLRDIGDEARDVGSFRLDLYARLSTWELRIPALRERRADILLWLERFHTRWHEERARAVTPVSLSASVVEKLLLHDWPDNLRGLQQIVHRHASHDPTQPYRVDMSLPEVATPRPVTAKGRRKNRPRPGKAELLTVLNENAGSIRATAKHFERDRKQIYRWLERYGIDVDTTD